MNHAAVNKSVQVSLGEPAFDSLEYIPKSGIAGSHGNSICNFFD